MSKLSGQTALVTGAGRGLGRVYALRLADLGANVGVIDKDLHSYREFAEEVALVTADTVVEELEAKGVKAAGVEADLTDEDAVNRAVAQLASDLGDITILVANAGGWFGGITESRASLISGDQYRQVMGFNFFSTVYCVNAVAPFMKKRGYGKIVTVASEAALQAKANGAFADYATAKAAIVMYTKYLAQDLGPYGINVNCLSPGFIETGAMIQAGGKESPAANALGRFGKPHECANVVEFLTTDASDYVAGAVIDTSGGWVRAGSR